ncbi:MAG: hypothetical protein WCD59_03960, partial [Pseudolabrys sp.]
MIPLEAASHRSQALCLFIKRLDFLILSRHLRFRGFGAAQLFKRLADGEFRCFSHGKSSSGEVEDGKIERTPLLPVPFRSLHSA